MKRQIMVLFMGLALFSSCYDAMNEVPLERMPPEIAFKDSLKVEMFVNELYVGLNTGIGGYNSFGGGSANQNSFFDCVTDLGVLSPRGTNTAVNSFTRATFHSGSGGNTDSRWAQVYQYIRKTNLVLEYIHYCDNLSESKMAQYIGEAKLHKALLHYEMLKRYGGITIMDDLFEGGNIELPRNTFEECVEYIVHLCEEAAGGLPLRYPDNDYGRLTKGAALGLKAKVLLYAASPLFNENPIAGTNEIQRYASADNTRWDRAAKAALDVINLKMPDGSPVYELFPSYERLFFTREENREFMIMIMQGMTNNVEVRNGPAGYPGATGNTSLTQEFIDMFELTSGKLPKDDTNYDPQKPWENRCKRFYASVLYNGAFWWDREVETFVGGKDYTALSSTAKGCVTGYTLRKHLDPEVRISGVQKKTYHDFPLLRFAEILLTYAEAANEYNGMSDDDLVDDDMVYSCVNRLRERAGLPMIEDKTKGEMREIIHRERTVELAFECVRYFDLRRWREAERVLNRPVHGVQITKDVETGDFVYSDPIEVEERIFPERCYYYPIPQSELNKNAALTKNPGW
ncbi:RagB/SusD family nutrient uptake outer membrane protein [Bacteroides ovatus]|uniref:Starch-binding associating with outer membrane n=1 Tax=Bacteroides ovatus TaxID=28116 RepID=A0A1G7ZRT8_BACOV|nr:RagB/SusD family nutrient uptake outer membrane protein [Bacteroides ovatus]SDH11317.1 Starch-binding associating with outer membrane [Bacteroides ovatus]